jgi:hypothetical protein
MKVLSDFRRVYRIPHERAHRNHSDIRAEVLTDVLMEFPMKVLTDFRRPHRIRHERAAADFHSDIRIGGDTDLSWNRGCHRELPCGCLNGRP